MYDPIERTYEDMAALKYKVELNESERTHLKQMASRGETSARKVKRALVLLKADEGMTDRDIASGLLISASTVGRVRTRFVKEGQRTQLTGTEQVGRQTGSTSDSHRVQRRTRRTRGLDDPTACRQGGGDGVAESISLESQILKKTNSSRGRRRSGASRR